MSVIYFECVENKEEWKKLTLQKIEKWISSVALSNILESFNATIPEGLGLEEVVEWLLKFSEEWDYRKKQQNARDVKTNENARWLVDDHEITPEQMKAVKNGINELGLINVGTPLQCDYDYVVALGGARLSCLLRPLYAHEVIKEYGLIFWWLKRFKII